MVIARNEYDALGHLRQKNLHQDMDADGFWQSVDYRYNIRGWLTEINQPTVTGSPPSKDFWGMYLYYNTGSNAQYNGNISALSWQTDLDHYPLIQRYEFGYDGLNRLETATYMEQNSATGGSFTHNVGHFDVNLSYDLNGNITHLDRDGRGAPIGGEVAGHLQSYSSFVMDDLSYAYAGNQLESVSDGATVNQTNSYAQFIDGGNSGDDYAYDANGNLTEDQNKGITSISYNHLNKPTVVVYSDFKRVEYYYGADGRKLRQVVKHPSGGGDPPPTEKVKQTDYLGGIQYEDADGEGTSSSLEILLIVHEEGRYRPNGSEIIYEYNLRDHLGNTRVTFGDSDADGDAEILQENHYYPFGLAMTMSTTSSAAPPEAYLYNGKELQDELDLGWYDYGARMYDPSIGRWNGVDIQAESYFSIAPYTYVANNPVILIDPNGEEIWITLNDGFRVRYVNGALRTEAGESYEAEKGTFAFEALTALNELAENGGEKGALLIQRFSASEGEEGYVGDVTILKTEDGHAAPGFDSYSSKGEVYFNPDLGFVDQDGNVGSPTVALAHELADGYLELLNPISNDPGYTNPREEEDLFYGTVGEREVIEEWETPISLSLGQPVRRKADDVGNVSIRVRGGVTSTHPKNPLKKMIIKARLRRVTRSSQSMREFRVAQERKRKN